jgi:hypothetical protein
MTTPRSTGSGALDRWRLVRELIIADTKERERNLYEAIRRARHGLTYRAS